jgi:hypothetical protein
VSAGLRSAAFVLLLVASGAALLALFARPDGGVVATGGEAFELPIANFGSSASRVAITASGVRAEGADGAGVTLLMQSFEPIDAGDFRYLSFDLDRIPTLSRPILVWGDGSALRLAALPDTPFARATVDLTRLPDWTGQVSQLGIALMPTDYLAPALLPETTFELRRMRLEPVGWGGALRTLWSDWSAYRPWNGRSNHTLGFELGARGASLQAFLASWLAAALLVLRLCFGAGAVRRCAIPIVLAVVLGLALLQLRQLAIRAAVGSSAAAVAAAPERPLAALPDLGAAAFALNARLREEGERRRVLVYGTGLFLSEYPTWLLREQDAATLRTIDALPTQAQLEGWLLVLAGEGDWSFDAASGSLRLGTQQRQASLWFDAGALKAYRFDGTAGTP